MNIPSKKGFFHAVPPGTWTNFFTGEQVTGGKMRDVKASLEDIPVYAKLGAIVLLAPKVGWGGTENPTELDVYIFPGADNTFDLYEDDGETTDYQQGKSAITRFELKDDVFTIHPAQGDLSVIPAQRTYRIHLPGVNKSNCVATFTLNPAQSRKVELHLNSS